MIVVNDFSSKDSILNQCIVVWNKIAVVAAMLPVVKKGIVQIY